MDVQELLLVEDRRLDAVIAAQGAYFTATGVWSLVDLDSFERVTGPKVDTWLVKTVGVLVTAIGAVLLAAGARRRVTPEIAALAASSAAGLAAIDVVYTRRRRISPIYLLDAVAEAVLLAAMAAAVKHASHER